MSEIKLKPCPFCGNSHLVQAEIPVVREFLGEKKTKIRYQIYCASCGCKTGRKRTEQEAEEVWNTRKPMEQIIEQLKAEGCILDNAAGNRAVERIKAGGIDE